MTSELIWTFVSFILTVLVFSYLLGDNPVFKFVSALFVGITAGYFAVVIIYQVILARLVAPLLQGSIVSLIPLVLSGLLLLKLSPRLSRAGDIPMAVLVGVGAAVAIGGAVLGTLFGRSKGRSVILGRSQMEHLLNVQGRGRYSSSSEPWLHWLIFILALVERSKVSKNNLSW
jgi:hypothetical protein